MNNISALELLCSVFLSVSFFKSMNSESNTNKLTHSSEFFYTTLFQLLFKTHISSFGKTKKTPSVQYFIPMSYTCSVTVLYTSGFLDHLSLWSLSLEDCLCLMWRFSLKFSEYHDNIMLSTFKPGISFQFSHSEPGLWNCCVISRMFSRDWTSFLCLSLGSVCHFCT